MAAERDFELLDDYLANRLDEKGRLDLEQKLNTDPDLRSEFELQQQFVNGIKKARAAELKAFMNALPVPAVQPGLAAATKVVLGTLVAGAIGTGIYLYVGKEQEKATSPGTKTEQSEEPRQQATPAPDNEAETKQHEEAPDVSAEESSSEQQPVESPKAIKKARPAKEASENDRKLDVFEPATDDESESAEKENTPSAPEAKTSSDLQVEIDAENKKYSFHYQFKDSKLFLYGPFEKNLYEIMEFFSDEKRTVFLFYKDNYYLLQDDNQKLKPLTPIQDQTLLKKLRDYRK